MGKCRTKRITFASGLSSDCSPCRRVVRGNACSGNTAAHTAPSPAAALRQCLIGTFLHRQCIWEGQCFTRRASWWDEARLIAAQSPTKPPSDSVSKERCFGKVLWSYSCVRWDVCDARCGFAPPGTNAGTKAQSATSLRLTMGTGC